jgi:hypothetical protein
MPAEQHRPKPGAVWLEAYREGGGKAGVQQVADEHGRGSARTLNLEISAQKTPGALRQGVSQPNELHVGSAR